MAYDIHQTSFLHCCWGRCFIKSRRIQKKGRTMPCSLARRAARENIGRRSRDEDWGQATKRQATSINNEHIRSALPTTDAWKIIGYGHWSPVFNTINKGRSPLARHELDARRRVGMKRVQAPSVFWWAVHPEDCGFGGRGKRPRSSRSERTYSPSSNSGLVASCALESKQLNYNPLWPWCINKNLNPKWKCCQRPVRFVTCWRGKVWSPEVMLEKRYVMFIQDWSLPRI